METEGILTADIIRLKLRWTSPLYHHVELEDGGLSVQGQQLKQHEEAAAKAKLAAGQKEALIGATVRCRFLENEA